MLWGAHGRWHRGGNTCERYHVESKGARAWWRSHKDYFNPIWDTVPITSRLPAKLTLTPRCLGLSFQHKNSRGASLNYVQTIVHLKKDGSTCHHRHWHTGISFQKTLGSQKVKVPDIKGQSKCFVKTCTKSSSDPNARALETPCTHRPADKNSHHYHGWRSGCNQQDEVTMFISGLHTRAGRIHATHWFLGTLTQLKGNVFYGNPGLNWVQLSGACTLKSDFGIRSPQFIE